MWFPQPQPALPVLASAVDAGSSLAESGQRTSGKPLSVSECRMLKRPQAAAEFSVKTFRSSARLAASMRPIRSMLGCAVAVTPHVWHELPGCVQLLGQGLQR